MLRSRAAAVALVTFATFTDIVAYSVAIPVLPDLSRKLGASPTMIGLLFASFGVTLLIVSIPMGAVSDRVGRKGPMVGGLAALAVVALFLALDLPAHHAPAEPVPLGMVLRVPAIAACALVVIGISSTISMLEPVLALHLAGLGVSPARLGLMYGAAAVVTTTLNPIAGRFSDRRGSRRTMMLGLVMMAVMVAVLGQSWSYGSALVLFVIVAATGTFVITPSLA